MTEINRLIRRQKTLADFGDLTLRCDDLDEVLAEACRLVGEAMETGRSKVLEIQQDCLVVRAGVGWRPQVVGTRMPMGERSSETYAIELGQPVITNDIREEDRFDLPPFMAAAGVVALANVPIILPGGAAYGLLQVDDLKPRAFDDDDTQFLRTYATLLGPAIDRLLKVTELGATEERFGLIVENARDYAIFLSDPEDRVTDWFSGAKAIFGWSAEEIVGRSASILFTPEDRRAHEDVNEIETARAEGVSPDVRWHLAKDGSRVFIEGSVRRLEGPGGSIRGFLKIGQDVTERRQRDERLRESDTRFRQFGEASSDVIWIRNADTLAMEYLSPAFEAVYGAGRERVFVGDTVEPWLALLHPDDREGALDKIKSVRSGAQITHEFRIIRPSDNEVRWIENTDFPLTDEDGRVQRVGGLAKDVTDNKISGARLEVLVAELQHRSRNLLGVVASVATKTLANGGSVEDFQLRLKALSRAQALLSEFGSDTVEVGALVRAELEAHTGGESSKITLSGPKVHLTASQVQNYALALHELATNAVKYGALKSPEGALAVDWALDHDQRGRRRLVLTWVETGVEIPPGAADRRGYGRELIEKALSYALRAKTDYSIDDGGIRCRIDLPLS